MNASRDRRLARPAAVGSDASRPRSLGRRRRGRFEVVFGGESEKVALVEQLDL